MYLVGYLYYWQMGFNSVFKGLKVGAPFKNILLFHVITFVRRLSVKLRNLKLRKSGRVSTRFCAESTSYVYVGHSETI